MSRFTKASLLLFFFSLCGAAFFVAHRLEEARPAPAPRELFVVVNDQLAAFRVADFQSAYRRASTGVQQKFTLPQFESMVRHNYAALTSAQRVEFGSVTVRGNTAAVQVFFFAPDDTVRSFVYNLVAEASLWKIAGVQEIGVRRATFRLSGTHA